MKRKVKFSIDDLDSQVADEEIVICLQNLRELYLVLVFIL